VFAGHCSRLNIVDFDHSLPGVPRGRGRVERSLNKITS
jgi:hypothetical protein